jgi:hypothetical protein
MNARYYNGEPEAQHDPNADEPGIPYVCTVCNWKARGGVAALEHHVLTLHQVRGANWPKDWPDAQFTCCQQQTHRKRA